MIYICVIAVSVMLYYLSENCKGKRTKFFLILLSLFITSLK